MRSMSNTSAAAAAPVRRKVRRATAFGVLLDVCVILAFAYLRTADSPGHHPTSSVEFGWSWSPLGFTCTYGDGTAETSLWF